MQQNRAKIKVSVLTLLMHSAAIVLKGTQVLHVGQVSFHGNLIILSSFPLATETMLRPLISLELTHNTQWQNYGGTSVALAPPAQSNAHFVRLFKSFKISPSLSKSVQRFKGYRPLKLSTQKPPEIPILAVIF